MTEETLETLRQERDNLRAELARERMNNALRGALVDAGVVEPCLSDALSLMSAHVKDFDGVAGSYGNVTGSPIKLAREFLKDRPHFALEPRFGAVDDSHETPVRSPAEMTAHELFDAAGSASGGSEA